MATNVGGIYYTTTLDTSGLIRSEREVKARLSSMGDAGDQMKRRFTAIAAGVSAAISAIAIEGFISKMVGVQRQFDVMFSSLKTVTGGVDQANSAWERLNKFAAETPFSLDQTVNGFVKLKALGLDPSERAMRSFGNTSSAMGKDLTQMIEAVADASTGEFERLKEFGIKAKQNGDEVSLTFQGVTTTIKNNSAAITEYLTKIGEVNFAGAMSERMNTLDGDISNLEDSWNAFYLSVSKSGLGDAVRDGVQTATRAIQEMTQSVKQGGLTDYFNALKSVIPAVEVAVLSLSGVIALKLIAQLEILAWRTVAATAAMVSATTAAGAFSAVISALGGPIGIAISAIVLLAMNWDKLGFSAKTAADISEDAARRISGAQAKSAGDRAKDLAAQVKEHQEEIKRLAGARTREKISYTGPASADTIKEIDGKIEAHKAAISKINDLNKPDSGLKNWNDGQVMGPNRPTAKPGTKTPKAGKSEFDATAYLATLKKAAADELGVINATEAEATRIADKHYAAKEISAKQHEEALTLIRAAAGADRAALEDRLSKDARDKRESDAKDDLRAAVEIAREISDAKAYSNRVIGQIDPAEALRMEYESKLAIVIEYEQLMAAAGIEATEQAQAARTQIETEYGEQRRLLAEQTFASQSEANAFMIESLNALAGTATTAITGLLTGTMSAQDAMRSLAGVVLNEAVGALVQIGIQQIKNALIGDAILAADKAKKVANGAIYTASVSAQVAGMSSIAAMNAFAATAAIPMIGPALAPAAAAAAAAASAALGAPAIATAPLAGARRYGGPTSAGSMYRVNEAGRSEMFTASNGSQYFLPTKSGRVTSADKAGDGGGWTVVINNNGQAMDASVQSVDQSSRTVALAVNEVARQISSNTGPVFGALRSATNTQGRVL